jgi:hypothetical protein
MKAIKTGYAMLAVLALTAGRASFAAGVPAHDPHAAAAAHTPAAARPEKPAADARPEARAAAAGKIAPVENKLEGLIRPELLIKNAEKLGLTQDQVRAIRQEVQTQRQKLMAMQQTLQTEMTALNALLTQPQIDQHAALAQLDKVLDVEREIKKSNMALSLSIVGQLTPQQREQALALMKDNAKAGAGQKLAAGDGQKTGAEAIRAKMQEVQALAKKRQAEGHDIKEARKLVESVKALMQEGKTEEAEKALDEAKRLLE